MKKNTVTKIIICFVHIIIVILAYFGTIGIGVYEKSDGTSEVVAYLMAYFELASLCILASVLTLIFLKKKAIKTAIPFIIQMIFSCLAIVILLTLTSEKHFVSEFFLSILPWILILIANIILFHQSIKK